LRIIYLVALVLIIGGGTSLFGLYLLHNQAQQLGVLEQGIEVVEEEATLNTSQHSVSVLPLPLEEESIPVSGPQATIPMAAAGSPAMDIPRKQDETNTPATRIEITPAVDVLQASPITAATSPILPVLDHSILRLQAVTWAPVPHNRFALVGDTILRKGESIKGFVIDSIEEDHLVVGKGGQKWRVEFMLR